jgi:hypothetical protein
MESKRQQAKDDSPALAIIVVLQASSEQGAIELRRQCDII